MSITHGKNLIIKVGGTAVASARSCNIEKEMELIEVGGSTAQSRNYRPGRTAWRITCSYLVSTNIATLLSRISSTALSIAVTQDGTQRVTGTAYCNKCAITATRGNLATGSFTFQGTGDLS